jgi:hypothetical protein
MSSIVVSGDTSGAITIAAPAVAGTNTLTLPASTGTVALTSQLPVAGPTFSAYTSSNTSISSGVATKVPFNLETFDTANCFDSTTNYRFTPTVAGYYQLNSSVYVYSTSPSIRYIRAYKNGSVYQTGNQFVSTPPADTTLLYSGLIYFNGTTDYAEMYVFDNGSSPTIYGNSTSSNVWFSGCLVRSA